MKEYKKIRAIISGGGTGGHIFPAISIANKLKELNPDNEILFVGANGKMEMEKVPAAGYEIIGLPIVGIQRQLTAKNIINDIQVPFKLLASRCKAAKIIKKFKPDIAIGVGGYASAPMLFAATSKKIPSLIQEQNGFAGMTNRILGNKVACICVAYDGMEKFFPKDKIVFTGNPIRSEIHPFSNQERQQAIQFLKLDPEKKQLLIVGGSLGSATLNRSMKKWITDGCPGGDGIEVMWQCGRYYKSEIDAFMAGRNLPFVHFNEFIARMDLAYAAADVVISRSGASSISELCAAQKACIFVPSPNVAEDHQTHNAMALVNKGAARIVKDSEAPKKLMAEAANLLADANTINEMKKRIAPIAKMDAAMSIAEEIYKLV